MVSRGEGSGEGTHDTLMSDTIKPNGRTGTDTRPGVWLPNKPTDLSACVIEECGHGEGGVPYVTLLSELLDCQIHYIPMVVQEQTRVLGFGCVINQRTCDKTQHHRCFTCGVDFQ